MVDRKRIITGVLIIVAALAFLSWLIQSQHQRQVKLTQFAQCLKDSGAIFYGAFWCPHCQEQKALFDTLFSSAKDKLPYVECSTPDTNGQTQICKDELIRAYPTWKFKDGSKKEEVLTLKQLSEASGCQLP